MDAPTLPSRARPYLTQVAVASADHGVDPALIFAVMDRESQCGLALGPDLLGDHGHGHAWMQIDDRTHGLWLMENDWRNPAVNIEFGAQLLAEGLKRWNGRPWCAACEYNAGPRAVRHALDSLLQPTTPEQEIAALDRYTTGGDYVSDVMQRMKRFAAALAGNTACPMVNPLAKCCTPPPIQR